MDESNLSPEHAHVLNALETSFNKTFSKIDVHLAEQTAEMRAIRERIEANDDLTQRIDEKLDTTRERVAALEGASSGGSLVNAKTGFYTSAGTVLAGAAAWFSGLFER